LTTKFTQPTTLARSVPSQFYDPFSAHRSLTVIADRWSPSRV